MGWVNGKYILTTGADGFNTEGGLNNDGYLTDDALTAMNLDPNIYKNITPVTANTLAEAGLGETSYWDKFTSAFTPQGTSGYSTAGQMAGALGTLGSLWGTYEATKAAKEANKLKREQYDYLKSRDAKSDAYKSNLGLAFASAYQGPKYTSTPTAPATAPVKL